MILFQNNDDVELELKETPRSYQPNPSNPSPSSASNQANTLSPPLGTAFPDLLPILQKLTSEKIVEPLHRNPRLRSWPSSSDRRTIYRELYFHHHQIEPSLEKLQTWKQQKADALWLSALAHFSEDQEEHILREYSITHIAQNLSEPIFLEETYTPLKTIGQAQWNRSSDRLRQFASEEKLLSSTDSPELLTENGKTIKIPDWQKGLILYHALQNSHLASEIPNPSPNLTPNLTALKSAARWALGPHLTQDNKPQNLEATIHLLEEFKEARQKPTINLQLVPEPVKFSINEAISPTPRDNDGRIAPWILTWKIIPNKHATIRETALKQLEAPEYREALRAQYKRKFLDRWITNLTRRIYFRKLYTITNQTERYKLSSTFATIDNLINIKMPANTPLIHLMAKTEHSWNILTHKLPPIPST